MVTTYFAAEHNEDLRRSGYTEAQTHMHKHMRTQTHLGSGIHVSKAARMAAAVRRFMRIGGMASCSCSCIDKLFVCFMTFDLSKIESLSQVGPDLPQQGWLESLRAQIHDLTTTTITAHCCVHCWVLNSEFTALDNCFPGHGNGKQHFDTLLMSPAQDQTRHWLGCASAFGSWPCSMDVHTDSPSVRQSVHITFRKVARWCSCPWLEDWTSSAGLAWVWMTIPSQLAAPGTLSVPYRRAMLPAHTHTHTYIQLHTYVLTAEMPEFKHGTVSSQHHVTTTAKWSGGWPTCSPDGSELLQSASMSMTTSSNSELQWNVMEWNGMESKITIWDTGLDSIQQWNEMEKS